MKVKIFILIAILSVILPWRARAAVLPNTTPQPVLLAESENGENEIENNQGEYEDYQPTYNQTVPSQQSPTANTTNSNNLNSINSNLNPSNNINTQTIPATNSVTVTSQTTSVFPWAWIITRAAGVASFILLGLLTLTGIFQTTGALFRAFSPAQAWSLHRAIASVLLISVVIHIGSLLFDHFINLKILDVLVPFASYYRPVLVALGIAGFYLLLLILSTSLYTMTKHPRFWRIIHYLGFPMFLLLFLHGILLGTDTKQIWMQIIYWATGSAVGLAVIYRILWRYYNRQMSALNIPESKA